MGLINRPKNLESMWCINKFNTNNGYLYSNILCDSYLCMLLHMKGRPLIIYLYIHYTTHICIPGTITYLARVSKLKLNYPTLGKYMDEYMKAPHKNRPCFRPF